MPNNTEFMRLMLRAILKKKQEGGRGGCRNAPILYPHAMIYFMMKPPTIIFD